MEWCTNAVLGGREDAIPPCREFSKAKKEEADAAEKAAREEAEASLAAAKKAEEEAAAAEDGVTDAYTAKVQTSGTSVEDLIKQKEKDYQLVKIQLGKDKENAALQ